MTASMAFGFEDEEAAVDPAALVGGLLLEGVDLRVLKAECAEAGDGLNTCEGDELAVFFVELYGSCDVDICDAVAVCHAEGFSEECRYLATLTKSAARARVVSPVSTRVTRQGSATESMDGPFYCQRMSKVTSEVCRK